MWWPQCWQQPDELKSELDGETLPSNGHEVVWRADPNLGGLPFQSSIQVTLSGNRSMRSFFKVFSDKSLQKQ